MKKSHVAYKSLGLAAVVIMLALLCVACGGAGGKKYDSATSQGLADAYLEMSNAMIMQGEYTLALNKLNEIRTIKPDFEPYSLYMAFGQAYYGVGKYEESLENYAKALKIEPKRTEIHNNIGLVHIAKGDYEAAIAEFNKCLDDVLYVKKQLPLLNMGQVYMAQNDYNNAISYFNRAIAADAECAPAYYYLGIINLKQNNPREAIAYLDNAAKISRDYIEAYMALGEAYEILGQKQEAAYSYGKVAKLAPKTQLGIHAQEKVRQLLGY